VSAFDEEFDYVYRSLRLHGVAAHDAEDLAQEVFLVMWRRWADFDAERPLRPWLAGIAFRIARDHRKRRWRETPAGSLDAQEDLAPQADERLASSRARELVLRALTRLPEKHRTMIVLHDIEGLSAQGIAGILRAPLATAYTRIRRARLAFAEEVRRLQEAARTPAAAVLAPEVLLGLERASPPAAPAHVRARLASRLAALAPLAAGPPRLRTSPAPRPSLALVLELGVATLATFALVASWGRPAPARRSPPAPLAARPVAGDRPRLAVATEVPAAANRDPEAAAGQAEPGAEPIAVSLARGLVGYWRFDELAGSSWARDLSGQGNDCSVHGSDSDPAWVDGVHGAAVKLDGHGWLECPQPELPIGTDPPALSISLWIRRARVEPAMNVALVTREMDPGNQDFLFFGFRDYKLRASSKAWRGWTSSSLPDVTGRWVHLAFTRAADGTSRLYVDGVEVARAQVRPVKMAGGRAPLVVGAGFDSQDRQVRQHFAGAMDELCLYDRSLSEEEVSALASGVQPRLSP
jgi:RNA polymerase sigma-70 factor (ECF subfamily)